MAEAGSGVLPVGWRRPMANDSVEYCDEDALPGPLALPSRFVVVAFKDTPLPLLPLASLLPVERVGRYGLDSCGCTWWLLVIMGVASRSWGAAGRLDDGCGRGMSDMRGSSFVGLTGFMPGEGGMPRVSRGAREPLLLRAPGTGGLSRGAGDDILASLELSRVKRGVAKPGAG